ncbi:hypothetical protein PsorP6_004536 [Peronosclerospora sorghi]|uniref:Uncharacterized protein n=1 Tax=Peronosclerospora sorghi TaxID=230839 RepID=A0ACC0VRN7_9STRA|nr:hypothetical protein PsorP6_004536 [Peronosclerospora sorghi]
MKGRSHRAQPRLMYNRLPSSLRRTLAGVSLGISIGVAGTLIVLEIEENDHKLTDRFPTDHKPILKHEALRYGIPSNSNVFVRSGYVVSFDYRTRNPAWVLEYVTKNSLRVEEETDRANSTFAVDKNVPEQFRVHPNRFLKSGYDKGHLAPARMLGLDTLRQET